MPDEERAVGQDDVEENYDDFDAAFEERAGSSQVEDEPAGADEGSQGEGGDDDGDDERSGDGDSYDEAFSSAAGGEPQAAEVEPKSKDVSKEIEKTKHELEKVKHNERSQRGRVAALTKKLESLRAAQEPPGGQEQNAGAGGAEEGDDWDEFEREFPEMAAIVNKRLSKVEQQSDRTARQVQSVADTTETMVVDEIVNYKAEQLDLVRRSHKDVDQIKADPAFATWRATASPEIQAKIKSHHAEDAIDVLDTFKRETGYGGAPRKSSVREIQERRQQNLRQSAGISSKRVGQPAVTNQDADDFDAAFEAGVRQKEKQRERSR